AGFVLYAVAAPFLRAFLYGVTTSDPATLAGATLALVVTASLASWLPARRASLGDPAQALCAEERKRVHSEPSGEESAVARLDHQGFFGGSSTGYSVRLFHSSQDPSNSMTACPSDRAANNTAVACWPT